VALEECKAALAVGRRENLESGLDLEEEHQPMGLTLITAFADEGGEAWVYTTGELVELMGTASAALARLQNARFDSDVDDSDEVESNDDASGHGSDDDDSVTFEISRRQCANMSASTEFMSESHTQYRPMFLYEKEDKEITALPAITWLQAGAVTIHVALNLQGPINNSSPIPLWSNRRRRNFIKPTQL
jgi:hypothetical protein